LRIVVDKKVRKNSGAKGDATDGVKVSGETKKNGKKNARER